VLETFVQLCTAFYCRYKLVFFSMSLSRLHPCSFHHLLRRARSQVATREHERLAKLRELSIFFVVKKRPKNRVCKVKFAHKQESLHCCRCDRATHTHIGTPLETEFVRSRTESFERAMKLSHFPDRFSQCNGQGTCRHVRGQTEASVCCARVLHVPAARLPSNLARSAEHA